MIHGSARRTTCVVLAACLFGPASASAAQPRFGLENPEALRHAESAAEAAKTEDYETAARDLKAAYAIEPKPVLLYAWAQAERLGGNYRAAIALYEEFLEQNPEGDTANDARANLLDARAKASEQSPPPPPPPAMVEEDDDEPGDDNVTSDRRDPPSADRREVLAPVLLGVGAAAAVTGGVLMGVGRNRVSGSDSLPTEDQYLAELESGRALYYAGVATLGAGGALILGGVIRYAVVATRGKRRTTTAMITPTSFGLRWSGRF